MPQWVSFFIVQQNKEVGFSAFCSFPPPPPCPSSSVSVFLSLPMAVRRQTAIGRDSREMGVMGGFGRGRGWPWEGSAVDKESVGRDGRGAGASRFGRGPRCRERGRLWAGTTDGSKRGRPQAR